MSAAGSVSRGGLWLCFLAAVLSEEGTLGRVHGFSLTHSSGWSVASRVGKGSGIGGPTRKAKTLAFGAFSSPSSFGRTGPASAASHECERPTLQTTPSCWSNSRGSSTRRRGISSSSSLSSSRSSRSNSVFHVEGGRPLSASVAGRRALGERRGRTAAPISAPQLLPPLENFDHLKRVLGRRMVSAGAGGVQTLAGAGAGATAIVSEAPAKKKVMVLMSDTGGGHRASAVAIGEAFEADFPGAVDVDIVDIWTDHSVWPFNRAVPTYKYLAKHPTLWKMSYYYGRLKAARFVTNLWTRLTCYGKMKTVIEECAPDLIISVHPLCHHVPMKAVQNIREERGDVDSIPFVTVVTDLGSAHPTWFDKRVDALFVPSPVLQKEALKRGIAEEKVHMEGLPLRSVFWEKDSKDKEELRATLGLMPGLPTALVVGGGDGIGRITDIATQLAVTMEKDLESSQLIVICGNNDKVKDELEARTWPSNVNVVVRGFSTNMDEWMGASDLLVTKAGPGTIAEASIKGLPIILSSFLPGQEKGNVPYVVEGGFGVFKRRPRAIAKTASEWLRDPKLLQRMKEAALSHGRPTATEDIVRHIGSEILFV